MTNSEDYLPSEKEVSSQDLQNRTEFLNLILRRWFHHLTALERLAVIFVFDRTYGWNKKWERITVNQFTQGVFGFDERDGEFECYAAPFTRDRTNAQKVVKRLVEEGVILRRDIPDDSKRCKEYALNEDWNYPELKIPERVQRMNASKIRRHKLAKEAESLKRKKPKKKKS